MSSSLDRRIKFVQREAAEAEAAEAKLYLRHKQDIDAALEHLKKENFLSAKELVNKLGEKKFLDLPYADVLREIESQRVLVEKFREVDNRLNKAYLADETATADLMRTVGELHNINEAASLRNPGSELSREIFSLLKSIARKLDGLVLQAAKKKLRKRTYIIFGVTFGACSLLLLLVIIWVARENAAAREEKAAAREEKAAAFDLRRATNAAPYINTLRMEFVPVKTTPGVLWSRWETRVRDYAAFCLETNRDHKKPSFEQGNDHPVVEVSFEDAQAFCVWLSKKEGRTYRLPTDHEWSCAVGIGAQEAAAASPEAKDMGIKDVYPWGTAWPPPKGSGNFDSSISSDSYGKTSPVGSFSPTADGLYDLSGNVWEWCDSLYKPDATDRVLRGGSWRNSDPTRLLSSYRGLRPSLRYVSFGFRVVLGVGGGG